MSKNQAERYRKVSIELSNRNLISLHELTRERIDMLLEEVESKLDSVSA